MARSRAGYSKLGGEDRAPPPRQSLFCVRFFILLILAGLSVLSIYVNNQITSLNNQIHAEELTISNLQYRIKDQQVIIDRFNNSVTNSDVQHKVQELEDSLQTTQTQMKQSLDQTTLQIQQLLNSTVEKLDKTVTVAQAEIQHEVDIVKGDVQDYVRTTQDQFSMENSFMIYQLAGTFCLLACLISMWHMTGHVRRFKRPFVQRKILAILWMSPIYSVTSWLSLVFPVYEGYLAIIKDFYEAYVIYQFLSFLISVLGRGNRDVVVDLLSHHADHLEPPARLFGWCRGKYEYASNRHLADAVLMQCQAFAMQFVFFKPMTAIGLFTCNKLGYYGHGENSQDYRSPQFWLIVIQNISVFLAFSGLLKFYHAVQEELGWCRPFPKFLCIKGIVFMTFWQGLVISILANSTGKGEQDPDDPDIWGRQAQNFLICLEMLLFSIAHFYCFPTEEWQDGYRPAVEKNMSAGDNLAFGDFMADLKLIMSGSAKKSKKKDKQDKKSEAAVGRASPLVADEIDSGTSTVEDDEEEALLKHYHEDKEGGMSPGASQHTPDALDSYQSNNDDRLDTTEIDDEDDLDIDVEDLKDLSSSFRTSFQNAIVNPNEDVREAASRLLHSIEQISEEKESNGSREADTSNEGIDPEKVDTSHGGMDKVADEVSAEESQDALTSCNDLESGDYGAIPHESLPDFNPEPMGESAMYDGNELSLEQGTCHDQAAPDELTSLLGRSSSETKKDVQLRPSIFTVDDNF